MAFDASTERGRRGTLAVVAGGNFAQLGSRLLLGPVVPLVLAEFDASRAGVGLALTGMWAVYALLQFPSGVLADRMGERRLLAVGLAGTVLGTGLIALSPSLPVFGAFVFVLGGGAGLFFAPASSLLSRLFERRGRALGLLTAGGALAGVLYPAVGGFVSVRYGWRTAVAAGTLVAGPALIATLRLLPEPEPANPQRRLMAAIDPDRLIGFFSRPSIAYTTALAVFMGFTFQAISSFFPTFLVQYRGIAPEFAGVLFAVVFGLSTLAQPVAGRFSDAVARDAAIAGSVTLTAGGITTLLAVPGRIGLGVGTVLLGVGVSWPGTIQARFMDQLEDDERGFGFGLARSVYMLLAASGSVVVGTFADVGGWPLGYGVVLTVLAVCLLTLAANEALGLGL